MTPVHQLSTALRIRSTCATNTIGVRLQIHHRIQTLGEEVSSGDTHCHGRMQIPGNWLHGDLHLLQPGPPTQHAAFYPTFPTPGAGHLWACGWRRLRPFGLVIKAQYNCQTLKLEPSSKSPPVESDFQSPLASTLLVGQLNVFRIPPNHSIVHPSFILLPRQDYSTAFRVVVFLY